VELDDQALEKYHQDAIEGKFRTKRGRRGVDLSDSDTDEETRAANRKIRPKKRRVDGDTLDELGWLRFVSHVLLLMLSYSKKRRHTALCPSIPSCSGG
jgi:hypothetical protein